MSAGLPPFAPSISCYVYASAFMARCLRTIIAARDIPSSTLFPTNAIADIKPFFESVAEYLEKEKRTPRNPPGSAMNYKSATDILGKLERFRRSNYKTDDVLGSFCDFLGTLQSVRELTDLEVETAQFLEDFFAQMSADGNSIIYEEAVGGVDIGD